MADVALLEKLIEPEVEAEGLALVRVKMTGGTSEPTLQVMAERSDTRQLSLEDCARLSRRISAMLDSLEAEGRDPIDHGYRLEVSSPGIDRPLTRLADYDDWKGHEARIVLAEKLNGRKVFAGMLGGTEGGTVLVDVAGLGPTGLPFEAIQSAKLVMTDRLIRATAPLSPEGADDIEANEEAEED
ncbi:ribosome maturation protein RimP [Allosphingosinicella sp.]|jgi:ribosome maturation factor RimP|uniref:ribosome maturation protein RimP n=1 Tax=Allosphingosinicella sp. TaxID=2823234 RepID=UPI002EFD2010